MELSESDIKRIVFEAMDEWATSRFPVLYGMGLAEHERRQEERRKPVQLSELDHDIIETVSSIYRDTGKPARTTAVATRLSYSRTHTLELCKGLAERGAIVKLPGKWGKFVPVAPKKAA